MTPFPSPQGHFQGAKVLPGGEGFRMVISPFWFLGGQPTSSSDHCDGLRGPKRSAVQPCSLIPGCPSLRQLNPGHPDSPASEPPQVLPTPGRTLSPPRGLRGSLPCGLQVCADLSPSREGLPSSLRLTDGEHRGSKESLFVYSLVCLFSQHLCRPAMLQALRKTLGNQR